MRKVTLHNRGDNETYRKNEDFGGNRYIDTWASVGQRHWSAYQKLLKKFAHQPCSIVLMKMWFRKHRFCEERQQIFYHFLLAHYNGHK